MLKRFAQLGFLIAMAASLLAPHAALAWTTQSLRDLRETAETATAEGLPPRTEALLALTQLERAGPSASLESAADRLFDDIARDFAQGAVAPSAVDPDWGFPAPVAPDLASLHAQLHAGGQPSLLLKVLLPQSAEYAALRMTLQKTLLEGLGAKDANGWKRETRLARLRTNLERWRWLPRAWPQERMEVRIAQFEAFHYQASGAAPQRYAVIVGRPQTQTPRFAAQISSLTLNPTLRPPASIVRELLPALRRDPQKAVRENFDVIDAEGKVVPPGAVNWSARPFPYGLVQRPGAANPLGTIRFNLPNRYAVYVHDTTNRALFAQKVRAFSHGCVRVQSPSDLGAALLGAPWTGAALSAEIARGEMHNMPLPRLVPVYFLYFTATARADGAIAFAKDVYDLDQPLIAALDNPKPVLVASRVEKEGCGPAA